MTRTVAAEVIPHVVASYIGVPFAERGHTRAGVNCWGLLVLFYREQYQIMLPTYETDYRTSTDREAIAGLMTRRPEWRPVGHPSFGDAVLFRIGGAPLHCGLWVTSQMFLHSERGVQSVLARFTSPKWRGRLLGVYRHRDRP